MEGIHYVQEIVIAMNQTTLKSERILATRKQKLEQELLHYRSMVSHKIMAGQKLTRSEFEDAVKLNYFMNKNLTYYDYSLISCYEDDERQAFLCREPAETKQPDGSVQICILGIHAHEVQRDWLRVAQLEWLKSYGWTDEQIGSGDRTQQPTPQYQTGFRAHTASNTGAPK